MNDSLAERERTPTPAIAAEHKTGSYAKPVLASEVLREELAPIQPGGSSCRVVLLGTAAAMVMLGGALRAGIGPASGASITFAIAGATAAVALLPFPYAWRASLCAILGVLLMLLGLHGSGPLAVLSHDGSFFRDASRLISLSVLPAALFFRAKYRAYRPARLVLAGAMLVSLPFVATQIMLLVDGDAAFALRVGALLGVIVILCGLFGFMGQDTTGAGTAWASLQIGILSGDIALREIGQAVSHTGLSHASAGVGTACAGALVSFGIYQILASYLAGDARRTTMNPERPRGLA